MIHIDRLRFAWPRAAGKTLAIDALTIDTGSSLFLHGPSGCGKSTLLSLLAGVLVADTGRVSLLGTDWATLSGARRDAFRADHVGYIFQQFNLLPYLTPVDNVLLPCRFSARRRQRAQNLAASAHAQAHSLLQRVGLPQSHWQQASSALSVGQQQRVAAARALIGRPEVVIADEPTSALDADLRDAFMDLLMDECRAAGSTLVFVSHDPRLAVRFDRQVSLPALNRAGAAEGSDRRSAAVKALLDLTARSAWNRRGTLSLVLLSIALATLLLLSLERMRADVRKSFSQSVSGTDLIVGARTGSVQLMLYAVFRVGGATNNLRMSSVDAIARHRAVDWVVPLSLGDSHRGFPVLGTTPAYFEHFLYGDREPLTLAEGRAFHADLDGLYDAVLGAEVAQALGYRLGQRITLSHGAGAIPGAEHGDKPFTVTGILARTGTPVDRTVHVSLEAIEAIHLDWAGGAPMPGVSIAADQARKFDLQPKQVTAALVGLKNRAAVFNVQRFVAQFEDEALMAVLPGVALDELWDVVGVGEKALLGMCALVALVSLAGLVAVVLAGLNERRRELAVLRAVGAGPRHVLWLLAFEGGLVTLLGVALGSVLTVLGVVAAGPWVQSQFGIGLRLSAPTVSQWGLLAAIVLAGFLASLVPGIRAYRMSLADGLSPRT